MATFASSTAMKRMLGIPSSVTTHDDAISDILDVVDQMVLDEIGLTAATSTSYTENMDITDSGQNEISLSYTPVLTVTSFKVSGQDQTVDEDYKIDKSIGFIKKIPLASFFPSGRNVIAITYTAGFSSVPADLVYAGNLIGVSLFNQQSHVGFVSERAGNYAYNMGDGTGSTIPRIAMRILSKHRRLFARGAV